MPLQVNTPVARANSIFRYTVAEINISFRTAYCLQSKLSCVEIVRGWFPLSERVHFLDTGLATSISLTFQDEFLIPL